MTRGNVGREREDGQKPDNSSDVSTGQPPDVLVKLAGKGPIWLRTLALLALILSYGTPYFQKFTQYLDDRSINQLVQPTMSSDKGTQPYGEGTPIPAPADAAKQTANALSPADAAHLSSFHLARMESPPFKRLPLANKTSVIAYSVLSVRQLHPYQPHLE